MSELIVESMKRSVEAMNRGDKEAWALETDPSILVTPVAGWPDPGPFRGIDDAWEFFRGVGDAFRKSGPFELVEMVVEGDRAVASVSREVWIEGEDDAIPMTVHMALVFKDGKLIENTNFLDRDQALECLRV